MSEEYDVYLAFLRRAHCVRKGTLGLDDLYAQFEFLQTLPKVIGLLLGEQAEAWGVKDDSKFVLLDLARMGFVLTISTQTVKSIVMRLLSEIDTAFFHWRDMPVKALIPIEEVDMEKLVLSLNESKLLPSKDVADLMVEQGARVVNILEMVDQLLNECPESIEFKSAEGESLWSFMHYIVEKVVGRG